MSGRRPLRRLAALAIGVAVAALGAELVVRFAFGVPLVERWPQVRYVPHATRGFALVPGDRTFTYDHPVRVNALGLRGPELPPRTANELRLLFLGDSLTFGHGVAEDDTIGAHVAAALRTAGVSREVGVVNAGHQGYATRQEVTLLRELGPAIGPDVVLLCWLWNDIQAKTPAPPTADLLPPEPLVDPPPPPLAWRLRQLARRSALLSWLNDLRRTGGWPDEAAIARASEKVDRELERFRRACEELGARPVFVVLPDAAALVERNPSRDVDARVAELARAHGLTVLDAPLEEEVRALIEERGALPVLPYDGHYDAAGNAALGRGIARGLVAAGVLK